MPQTIINKPADLPACQAQGCGSLALGVKEEDITTLDKRIGFVGKRIRTSKVKVTWSFNVKKTIFTVELLDSKSSGKKRVHVNGHLAKEVTCSSKAAASLQFRNTGLSFELTIASGKPKTDKGGNTSFYDLILDGHSFSHMHSTKLEKTCAEHALQQPITSEEVLPATADNHIVQDENEPNAVNLTDGLKLCADEKSDLRVSNSSVRASTAHSPRDSTQPDCVNVKMHGGLEENQMHSSRYTKEQTWEQTCKNYTRKSISRRKSKPIPIPEPTIQGVETLGHHDDFYSTDSFSSNRNTRSSLASVASSDMSSVASSQFNSALSHFDSAITSPTPSIPVAECVISPQLRTINPFDVATAIPVTNPFDAPNIEQKQQESEMAQLRAENAMLKLRAENAALKAHVQQQQQPQYAQPQHTQHYGQHAQMHYAQQCFQQQQRQCQIPTLISHAPLLSHAGIPTRSSMDNVKLMMLNGGTKIKQNCA